jgi:glycine betaine/proline transport system substrate-binding protein
MRQGTVDDSLAGNVPVEAGCAYETLAIHKGVNSALPDTAPELVDFLGDLFISTDDLNKVAAYMTSEDVEASEAAIWYLQNYEEQWSAWVPADIAENVKAALP